MTKKLTIRNHLLAMEHFDNCAYEAFDEIKDSMQAMKALYQNAPKLLELTCQLIPYAENECRYLFEHAKGQSDFLADKEATECDLLLGEVQRLIAELEGSNHEPE